MKRLVYEKARLRAVAYSIVAWFGVSMLFAAQSYTRTDLPFAVLLAINLVSWFAVLVFAPLLIALALRFRFTEGNVKRALFAHVAGLAAFLVIGGAMMGGLEWLLPWNPRRLPLFEAMLHAVPAYLAVDVLTYAAIVAAVQSWAFAREARAREVATAKLQMQLAEARLHTLNAQLQPHFLFNALNTISALVREQPKRAEALIARFSELLRESLGTDGVTSTSLATELDLLKKYLEIQQARFGDRLQVRIDVPAELMNLSVPRFLLQPIVENAIRHGVAPQPQPGMVTVAAERLNGTLSIFVDDTGAAPPLRVENETGLGLAITRARLEEFARNEGTLQLADGPDGGTRCTIRLPARAYNGEV